MTSDEQHEYGMEHGHAPSAAKVVCVDFDGTLFAWGPLMNWEAKPLEGAVEAVRAFVRAGFKISIFTSRMSERWLNESGNTRDEQYHYVFTMCKESQIPFDEIIGEKIPAVAYIDDKAIEFTGRNWAVIQKRVLALDKDKRNVTSANIKKGTDATSRAGHPVTGHLERDGNTFEDKELGDAWNDAYDNIENLKERIEGIDKNA